MAEPTPERIAEIETAVAAGYAAKRQHEAERRRRLEQEVVGAAQWWAQRNPQGNDSLSDAVRALRAFLDAERAAEDR